MTTRPIVSIVLRRSSDLRDYVVFDVSCTRCGVVETCELVKYAGKAAVTHDEVHSVPEVDDSSVRVVVRNPVLLEYPVYDVLCPIHGVIATFAERRPADFIARVHADGSHR